MPSSPIRSRSRSPVTPPADRDYKVPPDEEEDDRDRNDRDDRDERDSRDDRDDRRDDRREPEEDDDNLDFDWKKVLITALEDNAFSESSLGPETWEALEGASKEVACNVVKRVSESNLRNVRNLDGFARSILRRIEQEGIDVGRADLSALDRDVADAINRHVDDRAVDNSDFSTVQVVNALKEMPAKDAIEAIDQFAKSNLDHVRNRTGFFMSIIRRVKEEARGFSGGGRGGGRGGGGRYDDRYSRGGDRYGGGGGGGDRYGGGGDRYGGGGDRDYRGRGGYGDRGGGGGGYDRYERGDRGGGGGRDRYGDRYSYSYDRFDHGDRYGDRGGRYDRGRY